MSTPQEQPQNNPQNNPQDNPRPQEPAKPAGSAPERGHYGEVSPGVPRYGQYAPEGWQPPSAAPPAAHPAPSAPAGWTAPDVHPPAAAGAGAVPGAVAAPPRQVMMSFRLIIAAGAIQTAILVLSMFTIFTPAGQSAARQVMVDMGLTDTSMLQSVLVASLVLNGIGAVLYFLLAFAIRKGRNWARITGTVLACLSLLSLLVPNPITLTQVLLGIVAVFVLWRAPAKDYFTRK